MSTTSKIPLPAEISAPVPMLTMFGQSKPASDKVSVTVHSHIPVFGSPVALIGATTEDVTKEFEANYNPANLAKVTKKTISVFTHNIQYQEKDKNSKYHSPKSNTRANPLRSPPLSPSTRANPLRSPPRSPSRSYLSDIAHKVNSIKRATPPSTPTKTSTKPFTSNGSYHLGHPPMHPHTGSHKPKSGPAIMQTAQPAGNVAHTNTVAVAVQAVAAPVLALPIEGLNLEAHEIGLKSCHFNLVGKDPETIDPEYPLSPGEVTGWIRAHDKTHRPILKSLTKKINYISHKQFCFVLQKSIKSFESQFKLNAAEHSFAVLVEPNKSNQWVAELAYKELIIKPNQIVRLGIKNADKFLLHFDRILKVDKALLPKNVVLFDDGSYSGDQICNHVKAICDVSKKANHKLQIYVVIPYLTDHARQRLLKMSRDYSNVFIAEAESIPTVKTQLTPDHIETLNKLLWSDESSTTEGATTRGTYYFAHKVPNSRSFPSIIETGTIIGAAAATVPANTHPKPKNKFQLIPVNITPIYKAVD